MLQAVETNSVEEKICPVRVTMNKKYNHVCTSIDSITELFLASYDLGFALITGQQKQHEVVEKVVTFLIFLDPCGVRSEMSFGEAWLS